MRRFIILFLFALPPIALSARSVSAETPKIEKKSDSEIEWISLIKDSELAPWEKTNFGGEGDVTIKDGQLTLHIGAPMTGVTYTAKGLPKDNYEMRWEAQRTSGQDFFAGVTFPVGDEFCSFVGGGWGGSLTGLSSIDGYDASENETTGSHDFKNNTWYKFRIQVVPTSIKAWINDEEVVNIEREGKQFSVRIEMGRCEPLGYCTYDCTAQIRNWEYRSLDAPKKSPQGTSSTLKANPDESPIEFVRVKLDDQKVPFALQTSICEYTINDGPFAGAKIDLIGAVHVGEKKYYDDLNHKFKEYDSLLFELVANPDVRFDEAQKDRGVYNPLSAAQVGMKEALKLHFQLDEIDYSRKNFVHADMTPDEFVADMKKRKDSFVGMFARVLGSSLAAQASETASGSDAKILAALVAKNQAVALRRVMAEQFESMEYQLMGLEDKQGKSTLVTERNAKAFKVLDEQLKNGKKRLGVFYGAAHLKDMDLRLVRDFGAKRGDIHWLDAWRLDEKQ
jgi:Domain of Unknown Function (DUF1080)